VLGLTALLLRQGILPAELARRAWELWPLILVGIGVGLLFRRTSLEPLGGVIVAATFGLLLGAGIGTGIFGFGPFGGCASPSGGIKAFPPMSGTLQGDGQVTIEANCADLDLRPASGSGYQIAGEDDDGRGPTVDASGGKLQVRPPDGGPFLGGARDAWRIALGTDPTVRLDLSANAGTVKADLASMRVPQLTLSVNAGEATVDMGTVAAASALTASTNAGTLRITLPPKDMRGSLSANAGTIFVCAPSGVGLRFRVDDNITAHYDFSRRGLQKVGDAWQSADFATAEVRIEFEASANAGGITLDPAGGCGG
jgi:hypothetical protein